MLVSLNRIRAEEIDFGRASGAETADADRPQRASYAALLKNRRLLIFGACAALFQVASASMMPLLGGGLAYEGKRQAAPLIAALIIVPQLLVGLLAPWVGRSAEKHGRKPLLLVGFAALPIRAILFAVISNPSALIAIQLLDVITGAVMGVMTAVIIADVTKGTGRFNLAQGMFGTVMGVGATLSPTLTGLIVDQFGRSAGFASVSTPPVPELRCVTLFSTSSSEAAAPLWKKVWGNAKIERRDGGTNPLAPRGGAVGFVRTSLRDAGLNVPTVLNSLSNSVPTMMAGLGGGVYLIRAVVHMAVP